MYIDVMTLLLLWNNSYLFYTVYCSSTDSADSEADTESFGTKVQKDVQVQVKKIESKSFKKDLGWNNTT